ncbi:hypothetical protein GCM10011608_48920 [Micromonospora sonchi]|uniref:Uncharacterized protein n=1 Tax=Micromonospora sonchi TaxID=1763543 RepID=A0A917X2Q7_9ACTN|nr:hypothetical protein GCM10011608_48920 [Micromonospora sonchi]
MAPADTRAALTLSLLWACLIAAVPFPEWGWGWGKSCDLVVGSEFAQGAQEWPGSVADHPSLRWERSLSDRPAPRGLASNGWLRGWERSRNIPDAAVNVHSPSDSRQCETVIPSGGCIMFRFKPIKVGLASVGVALLASAAAAVALPASAAAAGCSVNYAVSSQWQEPG